MLCRIPATEIPYRSCCENNAQLQADNLKDSNYKVHAIRATGEERNFQTFFEANNWLDEEGRVNW